MTAGGSADGRSCAPCLRLLPLTDIAVHHTCPMIWKHDPHPQNRKYITATGNMHRKFREVWTCGLFSIYASADRQADTLIAILRIRPGGEVRIRHATRISGYESNNSSNKLTFNCTCRETVTWGKTNPVHNSAVTHAISLHYNSTKFFTFYAIIIKGTTITLQHLAINSNISVQYEVTVPRNRHGI